MADHTTFIVASDRDALILEKLAALEEGLQGLVPLLEKIVQHMEHQTRTPPVAKVAMYNDLYTLEPQGPPEGELVQGIQEMPHHTPPWWRQRIWNKS